MGVSRTQVVRFLKQGADAVNIIVSGDNIVFTDAGQILEVSIEVYIGTKKLQYENGSDNTFTCSILSSDKKLFDGNGIWSFRIDDDNTKFVYRIKLNNKIDLTTTIPYTVTVNDIAYNKSISVSTVYKGERGATPRGPQDWKSLNTGYRFYSGAEGEPYLDFVVYKNNYYLCKKSHTKSIFNYPTSSFDNNSGLWQLADKIDMVATQLLLATYIRVKNLGAGAIEMEDEEGNLVFVAKDGNVTCNTGTFKNVNVSGYMYKSKTIINESNYNDYLDTNQPFTQLENDVLDLTKTGTWIEFQGNIAYYIYMPSIFSDIDTYTEEQLYYVRSMVGNTIIMYYKGSLRVDVTGQLRVKEEDGGGVSTSISNGQFISMTCKASVDSNGKEAIYWLFRKGTAK